MPVTRNERKRLIERERDHEQELALKRQFLGPNYLECVVHLDNIVAQNGDIQNPVNSAEIQNQSSFISANDTQNSDIEMLQPLESSANPVESIEKPNDGPIITANDTQESGTEIVNSPEATTNSANSAETSNENREQKPLLNSMALRGQPLEYQFVPSNKNKAQVLYAPNEKQRYKKSKRNTKKGYMAMVCCERNCGARVYLYDDGRCVYADKFSGHNHSSTAEELVGIHQFKQDLKNECSKLEMIGGKLPTVQQIYMKNLEK